MRNRTKPADEGVYLRRTHTGFEFASQYDHDLGERWGIGSIVRADIHRPRSGKHNRWYRALVRTVWQHQDHYASPDELHKFLKWKLGEYNAIVMAGEAGVLIDFWSTAYDQMDEGEFNQHVKRAWDVIASEIIPGLDSKGRTELLSEIDRLLKGSA